jgi:hypothetical protein
MPRRFLRVLYFVLLLWNIFVVGILIAIFRNPMWHGHLFRFSYRVWLNFLSMVGSTGPGFLSPVLVSLLSIVGTMFIIGYIQGLTVMKQHWIENACIGLVVLFATMILVYGPQFLWEVAKTGYEDRQSMVQQVQRLQPYAQDEKRFQHDLAGAVAKADHWQDAFNEISKGEIVPDRILNPEDTDRLHQKLTDYARNSGDRRYSTVAIAPAFYEDQESSHLALQLLRVFKESRWNAHWETAHSKPLMTRLNLSPPVGIAIYTDDPHNQGTWIMWMLKDVGVDSYVAEDTPEGFHGTLLCVGYKQNFKMVSP